MLNESFLCTPLTRQEDSLRTPHSIEAWPCVRDSRVAGRGLVGAALDFEPELLLGRIKLTYDDSLLTISAEADGLPGLQAVNTHLFDEYLTGEAVENDVDAITLVKEADFAEQQGSMLQLLGSITDRLMANLRPNWGGISRQQPRASSATSRSRCLNRYSQHRYSG
jgi:hypothetical protein